MKFNTTVDNLRTTLDKIVKVSSAKRGKKSEEISNCLYLSLIDNTLLMAISGSEVTAYTTTTVDNAENNFSALIDSKQFHQLLTQLGKNDEVEVTKESDEKAPHIKIYSSPNTYSFEILDDYFPEPVTEGYYTEVYLPGESFLNMLKSSSWATKVLKKEDKLLEEDMILSGVLFSFEPDNFTIVSSDLKKVAVSSINWGNSNFDVIVPDKLVKVLLVELGNLAKPTSRKKDAPPPEIPDVELSVQENCVRFRIEDVFYIADTVKGNYPDLLTNELNWDYSLEIKVNDLLKTVKRLTPFTDNVKRMILFEINEGDKIKIKAFHISKPKLKNQEYLILDTDINFVQSVGVNADLLRDIMTHIDYDHMTVHFNEDPLKPLKITSADENSYYYLQTLRTD